VIVTWQTVVSVAIFLLLAFILYYYRKQVEFQGKFPFFYAGLIRTKLGLRAMDWGGEKLGWFIRPLAFLGIIIGFLGMALITFEVFHSGFTLFANPDAPPSVQPVLPLNVKGVYYIPFIHWILAIFLIAAVHEFCHGVVARAYGMKVKSSGFAFLGILIPLIPAAFVEPDEHQLMKRPRKEQLAVFAAGPFSNILFAIGLLLVFLIPVGSVFPLINVPAIQESLYETTGINIESVEPGSPAALANLSTGTLVTSVNGASIANETAFVAQLSNLTPGQSLVLAADSGQQFPLTLAKHPDDADRGYIGIKFKTMGALAQDVTWSPLVLEIWTFFVGNPYGGEQGLLQLLIMLNLGIGLFNLVPLGPVDGGRMFFAALTRFISEKKAKKIWSVTSYTILGILLLNIFAGFFK